MFLKKLWLSQAQLTANYLHYVVCEIIKTVVVINEKHVFAANVLQNLAILCFLGERAYANDCYADTFNLNHNLNKKRQSLARPSRPWRTDPSPLRIVVFGSGSRNRQNQTFSHHLCKEDKCPRTKTSGMSTLKTLLLPPIPLDKA